MLLELKGVTAGYNDATVLEDVTLHVAEGESLAILGRNGVGKTTLMLTVMGLTRMRAGSVNWDGVDISRLPTSERSRAGLGWVPQERDIFSSLTVEENLRVAARPGRMDLEAVYGLFPRLRERRRNMGDKLSGGEQQMLAIGRTLMTNPRLLLLDEPFEGLAPVIVDEIEDTMARLRTEFRFAIVIVEQHAEDVLRLSDRGAVLDRGQVVLEDRSEALLADFDRVRQWISV
ncbi:MAG: ABC transporter ATP-binding protein [Janthinobacterium lividum]